MADKVKRMLSSLSSSTGSHKDATGKYREVLEKALKFKEPELAQGLKTYIEIGQFVSWALYIHV